MSGDASGYEMEIVAKNYIKYRPNYKPELYDKILQYLDQDSEGVEGRRDLAIDVGCGSGQSTIPLAKYFNRVIGFDSSEAQLNEQRKVSGDYSNIDYRFGFAEHLSSFVGVKTVDLITVGMALHWFDIRQFFKECHRVLKPGGVVAVYYYDFPFCENLGADKIVAEFVHETMKDKWAAETTHVISGYQEEGLVLSQMFQHCIRDDSLCQKYHCSIEDIIGFFKSIPECHTCKCDHPGQQHVLDTLAERLQSIFNSSLIDKKVDFLVYQTHLLMGRKL